MFPYLKKVLDTVFPSHGTYGRGEKAIESQALRHWAKRSHLANISKSMEFPSGNIKWKVRLNLPENLNEWEVD
jgi:hypothetical protein